MSQFVAGGGPAWVAIGFGVLAGLYAVFWIGAETRKSGASWTKAAIVGVASAPFVGLASFLVGLLIWPLLVVALLLMLIYPLKLLTKGGRDDLAYSLRLGRWRDRR